jgi:hypothetical protein
MQRMRLRRLLDRDLRQPDRPDQSGRYEFAHRAPRLGERHVVIDSFSSLLDSE